jgi:hypothetical protein
LLKNSKKDGSTSVLFFFGFISFAMVIQSLLVKASPKPEQVRGFEFFQEWGEVA